MKKLEPSTDTEDEALEKMVTKLECEHDHLFFSRYFFMHRHGIKFIVNWHHKVIADALEEVIRGTVKNLIVTVPPGSSKTELVIINFIARGLALNPRARFLHLSYSDDLASLNSQSARELLKSEEYQEFWPLKISDDTKSKKRWNVVTHSGKMAGGVYATSISGQVTGFRAGHMAAGFTGSILLDDLLKPEDGFSKTKLNAANRKLLTTIKSRKASPDTPIVLIMQRIAQNDPVGFIEAGNIPGQWKYVTIPALIDDEYVKKNIPEKYQAEVVREDVDSSGRFSYWPYKEPASELRTMERGEGVDQNGSRVSRHVFASQYQQNPVAIGGNLIKGEHFPRYKVLPKMTYRNIYADTAQKTQERHDYSVFQCWGRGEDQKIYLLDQIRGKWESPELKRRAIEFWRKHIALNSEPGYGHLRKMKVEDKSSGTDVIQTLKLPSPLGANIPIEAIQRNKDKLTRVMDALPYIESGNVCIPDDSPFVNDFLSECEAFTTDDSHDHDDQVDPMVDAISDLISIRNKIKVWEAAAAH